MDFKMKVLIISLIGIGLNCLNIPKAMEGDLENCNQKLIAQHDCEEDKSWKKHKNKAHFAHLYEAYKNIKLLAGQYDEITDRSEFIQAISKSVNVEHEYFQLLDKFFKSPLAQRDENFELGREIFLVNKKFFYKAADPFLSDNLDKNFLKTADRSLKNLNKYCESKKDLHPIIDALIAKNPGLMANINEELIKKDRQQLDGFLNDFLEPFFKELTVEFGGNFPSLLEDVVIPKFSPEQKGISYLELYSYFYDKIILEKDRAHQENGLKSMCAGITFMPKFINLLDKNDQLIFQTPAPGVLEEGVKLPIFPELGCYFIKYLYTPIERLFKNENDIGLELIYLQQQADYKTYVKVYTVFGDFMMGFKKLPTDLAKTHVS